MRHFAKKTDAPRMQPSMAEWGDGLDDEVIKETIEGDSIPMLGHPYTGRLQRGDEDIEIVTGEVVQVAVLHWVLDESNTFWYRIHTANGVYAVLYKETHDDYV